MVELQSNRLKRIPVSTSYCCGVVTMHHASSFSLLQWRYLKSMENSISFPSPESSTERMETLWGVETEHEPSARNWRRHWPLGSAYFRQRLSYSNTRSDATGAKWHAYSSRPV